MSTHYPHEKRVQRLGQLALGGALVLGGILAFTSEPRLLGVELPVWAPLVALVAGAIVGFVAIARRTSALAAVAVGILALAVLPAGAARPSVLTYALGLLFGLALLLVFELVHMTERYERAHRAVDEDNVPEEHINRVTDEALRTLATRGVLAALAVAAAVGIAFILSLVGPAQWRAAVETSAPLGVAVVALALAGATSLSILARGAAFRLRREPEPKELLPDVAE